jgi:type VI protein secretion system component VasF
MTSQSIILVDGFEKLLAFWLAVKSDLVAYLKGEREFIVNETSISDVHHHVHNLLVNYIEQEMNVKSSQLSQKQLAIYRLMVYCFVATVDEHLLKDSLWNTSSNEKKEEGRHKWLPLLLEQRLFGSRNAGVRLVDRMAVAATKRTADPLELELAGIYLRALWLGFDEHFVGDRLRLKSLRHNLLNQLENSIAKSDRSVFDSQPFLAEIPSQKEPARLAPIAKWRSKAWYFIFGYIGLSAGAYWFLSSWLVRILEMGR